MMVACAELSRCIERRAAGRCADPQGPKGGSFFVRGVLSNGDRRHMRVGGLSPALCLARSEDELDYWGESRSRCHGRNCMDWSLSGWFRGNVDQPSVVLIRRNQFPPAHWGYYPHPGWRVLTPPCTCPSLSGLDPWLQHHWLDYATDSMLVGKTLDSRGWPSCSGRGSPCCRTASTPKPSLMSRTS